MKKFVLLSLLCMFLSTGWAFAQTGKYVEVIYFHGKQRCPTCRAIEKYTKEVVYNDFGHSCISPWQYNHVIQRS